MRYISLSQGRYILLAPVRHNPGEARFSRHSSINPIYTKYDLMPAINSLSLTREILKTKGIFFKNLNNILKKNYRHNKGVLFI
jgi:hypothetical protein